MRQNVHDVAASMVIAPRRVRAVGGLTPGITRRPEPLLEFDKQRVGGRVHAVVRRVATAKIHFSDIASKYIPGVIPTCDKVRPS